MIPYFGWASFFLEAAAAVVFAIPLLKSDKEIMEESATCFDYNLKLVEALLRDRKTTLAGLLLLILGLVFQGLSQLAAQ
jgi:hypothetical protein